MRVAKMIDEELSESPVVITKKPKKPVPLPRKNFPKIEDNCDCDDSFGNSRNSGKKLENLFSNKNDWKTASGIMQEKKKLMKSEVQKFEKSVRNIISKRKSVHPKSSNEVPSSEFFVRNSLPDDNIFCSISFNSPLFDDIKRSGDLKETSESDLSSNDGSYYTSELPPPYPPPDLPDESTYDEAMSVTSSDGRCSYLPSSDSNSLYEDLSKFQTAGRLATNCNSEIYNNIIESPMKSDSWSFYDGVENNSGRYEVIDETNVDNDPFSLSSNISCEVLQPDCFDSSNNISNYKSNEINIKKSTSNTSSLVDQFDPLSERQSEDNIDLVSDVSESFQSLLSTFKSDSDSVHSLINSKNPFQNPVILSSLCEEDPNKCGISSSAKEQMPCLIEGHYGKVRKCPKLPVDVRKSEIVVLDKYDIELPPSFTPPPIPPRRFDSVSPKSDESDKPKTHLMRWSSMKRMAKFVAENIENRTSWSGDRRKSEKKAETSEEGCAYVSVMLNHSGILYKSGGVQRWGVLSQRKLTLFANKDSPDVKETIHIDGVLSLKAVNDKISVEGVQIYCFELSVNSKSQPCVFGAPSASERHIWMRKLLESLTPNFPVKLMSDYTKAGLCYAKENISSEWKPCSLLLHNRILYLSPKNGVLSSADLRKARYLTLQTNDQTYAKAVEKGPMLLIDMQDRTLYIQMEYVRETRGWESAILGAALENGASLSEQQLTKDDLPTIVDKCVNFIHTHGSLSEGIYRRNGSNQTVTKLLAAFRSDAWAVQLTTRNYNEFDVSSVLKRFFRDLPEPLFVSEIHYELRNITETHTDTIEEKLARYNEVLKKLPKINYVTAKRLIGHLYFIDKQRDKNLMGVDNLSAIWGPTLLHVQGVSLDPNWSRVESSVLNDLITYYPRIFEIDRAEHDREMKILEVLETYHSNSNQATKKRSGDLKIWIHLNAVNKEECINISVSPQKLSDEICRELCDRLSQPSHLLCLEEVICGGSLSRPLHYTEKIFDTVLRWGYWDEADRKDNCLVLKKNDFFQALLPLSRPPVIFCEELKFADQKSRSFKTYQFEFTQAKLCCYKDKSCSVKMGEWKVEDIVWYIGHEPKRNPHSRWAITFIEKEHKTPRSKERPYFGNIICGTSEEQKMKLIAAFLNGQYPEGILPSPNLIE